jgi:excinuclease UvrABC helicase subunit UvrB
MTLNFTRVPRSEVPTPRRGRRWPDLAEALIEAHADGEAILVTTMSNNEASNFAQYMRPRGWKVVRRHKDAGFYLTLEPLKAVTR